MYVLDDVGFICHPNTGSRSLKKFLLSEGASLVGEQHQMSLPAIKKCRAVVSVVRNPYDVMASWYWRIQPVEFEEWLEGDRGYEGPHKGMFYGLPHTTHVIRFEWLEPMMKQAFEQLELPELKLPHIGNGKFRQNQHYRVLYNRHCITMVERVYGTLMAQLGYDF
jgi:hypothetical protein